MGAMFIGQQFLQNVLGYSTLDAGRRDHPGGAGDGHRRAAIGQAGRGARRAVHAAARLRLRPARVRDDAPALERGHRLLAGRPRLRLRGDRRRLRRHAGLALAHRLRAGPSRRHGLGHGRPPARPRRRVHAVDLRRAADRRLRRRRRDRARGRPERRPDHQQRPGAAHQVVLQRRGGRPAVPAVRDGDHRRRQDVVPGRGRLGLHRRDHRRPDRRGRSCSVHSRGRRTRNGSSPSTTPRTRRRPRHPRRRRPRPHSRPDPTTGPADRDPGDMEEAARTNGGPAWT